MKKALKLFLMFFVFFISGTILGTIFYTLYLSSLNLIADVPVILFSKENLMAAFFITSEILSFIIGFTLISYRIRHPGGILQFIAFVITQVICWGGIFPSLFYLEDVYNEKYKSEIASTQEKIQLSEGIFRVADNNVYYFVNDLKPSYSSEEQGTTTVRINPSEAESIEIIETKNPDALDISVKAAPYKDILIKKTFSTGKSIFFAFFHKIIELARDSYHKGWTFWLGFASLGFVLCCVYVISSFSEWRLINFSLVALVSAGILYWNYVYTTPALAKFRELPIVNINIGALGNYVDNIFLILSNLFIGVVLILVGTINFFVRKGRRK